MLQCGCATLGFIDTILTLTSFFIFKRSWPLVHRHRKLMSHEPFIQIQVGCFMLAT
jgi:hypothetical protein